MARHFRFCSRAQPSPTRPDFPLPLFPLSSFLHGGGGGGGGCGGGGCSPPPLYLILHPAPNCFLKVFPLLSFNFIRKSALKFIDFVGIGETLDTNEFVCCWYCKFRKIMMCKVYG
jgi:hypothetical protein